MTKSAIAEGLKRVLGDTYTVYMKTHGYHWNVTGPNFRSLHLLFEEQYRDMWASLDELAERIRSLGEVAPGSAKAIASFSKLEEDNGNVPSSDQMLKNLVSDHTTLIEGARSVIEAAEEAGDAGTADLLTQRVAFHEKTVWMLKSSMSE